MKQLETISVEKPGVKSGIESATARFAGSSGSLYELVARQPLFRGLKPEQLGLLAGLAMEIQFEPGEYIFREGDPANRFYLIVEGDVELEANAAEGGRISLRQAGPGDDIGWSWLFAPHYFHASARALTATRAVFFYGTRLRQQCEDDASLGYEMMKRISGVIVQSAMAMHKNLLENASVKIQVLPAPRHSTRASPSPTGRFPASTAIIS